VLTESTLSEAGPMVALCWAYDLVVPAGVLNQQQRRHIEEDLLKRIALDAGHRCHHPNSSNWRTWAMVIVAAGGFATGDRALIDEALNGVYDEARRTYLYGFAQQIAHSFFADGTFWEGQIGYTYYTFSALVQIAEMAWRSGIDLWRLELPGLRELPAGARHEDFGPPGPRSIRYGLDALFYRAFPNLSCARVGDSRLTSIRGDVRIFGPAYRRLQDPKYAWLIKKRDGKELQDYLYGVHDLPPGHFSFENDADIGLTGQHRNGCTLFPDGGYALLRGNGDDVEATCLEMHYGPYGSGHDHPDKLHVTLYGLDAVLAPDAGPWGYGNPMHLTWAKQTIAHNTVTIDQVAQYPQGKRNTIWAGERGGKLSAGKLIYFHPGKKLKAARATCDNAYDGCLLDRTLVLLNPFLIDVYRVRCDSARQIDWAWQAYGQAASSPQLTRSDAPLSQAPGYTHLEELRVGQSPGAWDVRWSDQGRSLRMHQLTETDTTLVLAKVPSTDRPRTAAIARRKAEATAFISVFEPYRSESKLKSVGKIQGLPPGIIGLELVHADGKDLLLVADKVTSLRHAGLSADGFLAWMRHSPEGAFVAADVVGGGRIDVEGRRISPSAVTVR
jgi:hypothetical protein